MRESSFILDARQALREADAALGKGHVAPLHERNLKARMADLLTHATYLEAQVAAPEAPRDDSEHADEAARAFNTAFDAHKSEHPDAPLSAITEAVTEVYKAGIRKGRAPAPAAPKPVALAYDTEAVAAKILAFFDRARGLCYCQEYRGETHDTHPPCTRRREANLLAIDLKPEAPRG